MRSYLTQAWNLLSRRLPMLLAALLPVLLMEILSRGHYVDLMTWSFQHILELLWNVWIVTGLILLFTSIIGRTRIAYWCISAVLLILSLISGIKLKMLGVPLLPWDFVLSGETKDMVQYLTNILNIRIIVGVVLFAAISFLLLYRTKLIRVKIGWKERTVFAVAALLMLTIAYTDKPISAQKWMGIEPLPWNQAENVNENGFALACVMNTKIMFEDEVEGYDDQSVAAILDQRTPPLEAGDSSTAKPNVIVVLSESFWDPTVIEGLKFSRDPIPFFHKLQETGTSGWMLSPQFGGGTANVEFEVLTGNSMRFLPQGSIPYNQFIDHEVDSLASIYARQGYTSTAISPFHNWYFNSSKVYENFGFSKFIPIEYFKPNYSGPYIADSEVASNIIRSSMQSDGPDFIFANTMENHFHFFPGKFPSNTIDIKGDISPESEGMLETLSQGISSADNMLRELVEFYARSGEPTIIAFWGDHLPFLGDDYATFVDTKYISGKDDPDFLNKMYRVPLVVWDNFSTGKQDKLDISPSFLGPYLIQRSGQQGSYYTDYLSELYKKIPVIPPKDHYAQLNIKEEDLKDYETLQYDILFGERHAYKNYTTPIVDPNYGLGFGPIQLDEALPDSSSLAGKQAIKLKLKGANIPPLSYVTLNGKPLPSVWESESLLTATVAGEELEAGAWTLQICVKDSKENVIGKSNEAQLTITE